MAGFKEQPTLFHLKDSKLYLPQNPEFLIWFRPDMIYLSAAISNSAYKL
jgi:hypothetical protein